MSICKTRLPADQRGFTLIELIIFIIVVSVAIVGLATLFSITAGKSADPQLRKQALALAEGMLEEVQLARFTFCDGLDPVAETATSANVISNYDPTKDDPPNGCNTPQQPRATTPSTGRPYYNVSDYVSSFGSAKSYGADAASNDFPKGYTVSVTIVPDPTLGPPTAYALPADATPANMNVLRITVTVTYSGQAITLVGYRTRYAPNLI